MAHSTELNNDGRAVMLKGVTGMFCSEINFMCQEKKANNPGIVGKTVVIHRPGLLGLAVQGEHVS